MLAGTLNTTQSNPIRLSVRCLRESVYTVNRWLVVSVVEFHTHVTVISDGTRSPRMVRIVRGTNGTKNPWYETSTVRKVHLWYETTMVRKVYVRKVWFPFRYLSCSVLFILLMCYLDCFIFIKETNYGYQSSFCLIYNV